MISVKRYLDNNESSEEKRKQLRSTCDGRRIIKGLESLPNELFYEIFDYLEGCQLYEAFSNLNIRFQKLITSSSLQLKIKLRFVSEELLQYRSTHIVTPNRHQIVSLSSYHPFSTDAKFPLFTIDLSFSRLESLMLQNVKTNELIPLLTTLLSLPRLFSLTIVSNDALEDLGNAYQIIFNLPVLKYNKLSFFLLETFIPLPITTNEQCSNIEYLILRHSCALDELIAILSYTPQLRRLSCMQVNDSNGSIAEESLHTRPNLTHISVQRCSADFDEFEMFITKISPQLQILRVTCSRDAAYLDADRWQRIISQHLSQLRRFEFKYEEMIDEDLEVTLHHELLNQFNSVFWTKRKWIFRISINTDFLGNDIIAYSIFPYEKSQINFHEIKKNDEHVLPDGRYGTIQHGIVSNKHQSIVSSIIFSEMNQLTVIDHFASNDVEPFTQMIGPILTMVQITCLNITRREIFIGTLIGLIKYLPNLHSLVVSTLEMMYPRCLSGEEAITLRLVANNNKTTKVNLQWMKNMAQVRLLLELCPRVEYLEVDCTNGIFLKRFVRFILMENIKYIPNLSSTCLKILQSEENIVEELKRMIDLEQLRHNYTIKQIDNRIYLQWNCPSESTHQASTTCQHEHADYSSEYS